MHQVINPHFKTGIQMAGVPVPSTNSGRPVAMLKNCPAHSQTPLVSAERLAADLNINSVHIKDERNRMNLGSFKALGAAYVIASDAAEKDISNVTYVTASAGNHGLSVAAGAAAFGASAVVYLSSTVPEDFAKRLTAIGATVVRAGENYEASMEAAQKAASDNNWILLSDSSWKGYFDIPWRLMEGYTAMAAEIVAEMDTVPTHIFLQAGVGGMAGALAACFRTAWGDAPSIIVVEPAFAPALMNSIIEGKFVKTSGPVSDMGRLDCKEASLIALAGLSRDANEFVTLTEDECLEAISTLPEYELETSSSGGAGIAAMMLSELPSEARALCILSEGPDA
jgi:diaminopropionate ammonia-lyase